MPIDRGNSAANQRQTPATIFTFSEKQVKQKFHCQIREQDPKHRWPAGTLAKLPMDDVKLYSLAPS